MAKIPPIQRLSSEEFKEQAGWIEKLLAPINTYMERTTAALDRALTIGENSSGAVLTVELDGTFPVRIVWPGRGRPNSVLVGNTVRSNGTAFTLAAAVQVQWELNQSGQLQINSVVGITPTAATKYKLTLICHAS